MVFVNGVEVLEKDSMVFGVCFLILCFILMLYFVDLICDIDVMWWFLFEDIGVFFFEVNIEVLFEFIEKLMVLLY